MRTNVKSIHSLGKTTQEETAKEGNGSGGKPRWLFDQGFSVGITARDGLDIDHSFLVGQLATPVSWKGTAQCRATTHAIQLFCHSSGLDIGKG